MYIAEEDEHYSINGYKDSTCDMMEVTSLTGGVVRKVGMPGTQTRQKYTQSTMHPFWGNKSPTVTPRQPGH